VVSTLKPGKVPTMVSFYRPICDFDIVGNPFEKTLLTKVVREIKESGLLREKQFGFDPGTARCCSWPTLLKI
jgi:hypothetical protein